MPKGIYKHKKYTKERCENISKALIGREFSKEHRKNISNSNKGSIPWNKGIPCLEKHKRKISKAMKRWHKEIGFSEETKKKIGLANSISRIGLKHSKRTKEKMSENSNHYWLEKKFTEEHKKKLRENLIIHHIDGNHNNDVPENRMEMTRSQHIKLHWQQGDYK